MQQAVLDAPMFLSRWRWNLNRALLVLRFRGGRRNPPPIQRMEADDLMAALFPQAAACQENITGPIEIPDHVIVRQTVYDTLHEALDVDGLRALLRGIEGGTVTVHTVDTTEPSVLAHEILTARPYAFLDDEELQNRRTNAVPLRRGLHVDLAAIGRLEAAAIARVHEEITPLPESADDLHDLLCSLVVTRPRREWTGLWEELVARGRAVAVEHDDRVLWCATETVDDAHRALADDDDAVTAVLRGHLELAGITNADALSRVTGLPPLRVAYTLAVLEREGLALQGNYRDPVGEVEWVSRRLLRAHARVLAAHTPRQRADPATARDFMRFLLRWQHVAPDTQLAGDEGVATVVSQLQGWEAAAAAWEPELFARRLRRHDTGVLDRLCHDGEVGWLRLSPKPRDVDAPAGAPNKATPISVVFRDDLHWLLAASRAGADPCTPTLGATAEIVELLRARGACFAGELAAATNRLPQRRRARVVGRRRAAGCSPPTASARSVPAIDTARARRTDTAVAPDARPETAWRRRRPVVARARVGRRRRSRRARRGRRRPVAPALGRPVPRSRDAGVVALPVARGAACAAPARRPRARPRRPVRRGRSPASSSHSRRQPSNSRTYASCRARGERVTINATDPCNLARLSPARPRRPRDPHEQDRARRRRARRLVPPAPVALVHDRLQVRDQVRRGSRCSGSPRPGRCARTCPAG